MNADHVDAMILLAKSHAGIEATEASLPSVDRLGFSLKLKTKDGVKSTRFNFLRGLPPHRTRERCSSRWCGKPRHEADFHIGLGCAGQIEWAYFVAGFAKNWASSAVNLPLLSG